MAPGNGAQSAQDRMSSSTERIRRRKELQQLCLEANGLQGQAQLSRAQAWLNLLEIDESFHEGDLWHQGPSFSKNDSKGVSSPSLLSDPSTSKVPLDKDGWQVASPQLLTADNSPNIEKDEEWKVITSKRSRRSSQFQTDVEGKDLLTNPSPSMSSGSTVDGDSPTLRQSELGDYPNSSSTRPKRKKKKKHKSKSGSEEKDSPHGIADGSTLLHKDHEQVDKDIQRSFVGPAFKQMFASPSSDDAGDEDDPSLSMKNFRRKQLSHLVMSTLSKYPALSYFQGYHDIITVLLLTFAPRIPTSAVTSSDLFASDQQKKILQLSAERLSLHLIRDSMTDDLQPVMGQLKILRDLLRACDTQLAELSERASALPFFALPWLLTLFTHDVDDISVSQHIMDFFLAYGPSSTIYLCAAILLAKKEDLVSQDPDDLEDPSMLHLMLSKLPKLSSDQGAQDDVRHQTRSGDPAGSGRSEPLSKPSNEKEQIAEDVSDSNHNNELYIDPDVELPSLASDRALASTMIHASEANNGGSVKVDHAKSAKPGLPITTLLRTAVDLMQRFPLDSEAVAAKEIMGPRSVIFTWPQLFDPSPSSIDQSETASSGAGQEIQKPAENQSGSTNRIDWTQQNHFAESVLHGPSSQIVVNANPDDHPDDDGIEGSDTDEKGIRFGRGGRSPKSGKRGGGAGTQHPTALIAVVGISGLLMAALYTQSTSSAGSILAKGLTNSQASALAASTTDETKRVLTLIVSLLTQWGRVVGG